MSRSLSTVAVLAARGLNEVVRVPGAAIPGMLAPTVFVFGLFSVFGELTRLPGFTTDEYLAFIVPVGLLQGAGFSGAATGVNLARDIERGWFDRLLAAPVPRGVLLLALVLSASVRALLPMAVLLLFALALGAGSPSAGGLLLGAALVVLFAAAAASWGIVLALRFRTQSAAPLIQAGMFIAVLFTTAYAPADLLAGWLATVARINPVTLVVEAVRQGWVSGDVTWAGTWPGVVALAGLLAVLFPLAVRGLRRIGE
jgi:ABC-2 type transport system permease protein